MASIRTVKKTKKVKSLANNRKPIAQSRLRSSDPITINKRFLPSIQVQEDAELEKRAVPESRVYGTVLERVVYAALEKMGVEFDFQSSLTGGRYEWGFGRQIADFAIRYLRLVIEVQGSYWHSPVEQASRDAQRELILNGLGWQVSYLEEDVVRDPDRLEHWLMDHVVFSGRGLTGVSLYRWPLASLGEKGNAATP